MSPGSKEKSAGPKWLFLKAEVTSASEPAFCYAGTIAMPGLGVLLLVGLLVLLPQLAGLMVTRFVRSASWTAWPAAAIAVFGFAFYWSQWAPARDAAAQMDSPCGMGAVALGFILVTGLVGHLGVGVLFGRLTQRLHDQRGRRRA